jgi:hypothetical protein
MEVVLSTSVRFAGLYGEGAGCATPDQLHTYIHTHISAVLLTIMRES